VTDQLHTLLTELAGSTTVLDPDMVKARARRLETGRRRRRAIIGAVAAAAIVIGGVVVLRAPSDPRERLEVTDDTEAPPITVTASGWSEVAHLRPEQISQASTMQDDGRTLLWTGSLVVIPGIVEAIAFDPATQQFGTLPPAAVDLSTTRGSYRGNLPWVWTGEEILRIDPTPLPPDASGSTGLGPLVGQAFSPATSTWRVMADAPVEHFTGIAWADDQLLAWNRDGIHGYHPDTDSWELLVDQPGPAFDASSEAATWTGNELVVVGPTASATFDPASLSSRPLGNLDSPDGDASTHGTVPSPSVRPGVIRVQWTGAEVVAYDATTGRIQRLDITTGRWRASPSNGMDGRQPIRSALWTGDRFVVWGGPVFSYDADGSTLEGYAQDGAAWDPATDTWQPIADLPAGMIPMSGVVAGDRFLAVFAGEGEGVGADDDRLVVLELHG
jgi:hypothetical protein